MQPSDNLSVAVSKISEARFSPHILRKKSAPSKPNVSIKNGSAVANPWSPPSTDSHAKGNFFHEISERYRWSSREVFFGHGSSLSPTRESALCLPKRRSNRGLIEDISALHGQTAVPSSVSVGTFDTFLDDGRSLRHSNRDFPSLALLPISFIYKRSPERAPVVSWK